MAIDPARLLLRERILDCTACDLHSTSSGPVPFSGPAPASYAIVGEAPGAEEDLRGEPFLGKSGQLLRRMLEGAGLDPVEAFIANTVSCLRGNTSVRLADGSTALLSAMVKHRFGGEVLSLDGEGRLVGRRVNGWYRTPLNDRRLFRVSHTYARRNRSGSAGFVATEDHLVLTKSGWKPAGELLPAVDLICTGKPGLSSRQEQLVLAGLLGDASVEPTGVAMIFFGSEDELDYMTAKGRVLATAGAGDVFASKHSTGWRLTLSNRGVLQWSRLDPVAWVEGLDDFGLACWYMDDGHLLDRPGRKPKAEIAVTRLPLDMVEKMAAVLSAKGIPASARMTLMGSRLVFNVDETPILSRRVAPYVVPSMRRKLVVADRAVPLDKGAWSPGATQVLYAPVLVHEVQPLPSERSVYCLGVDETQNFVTVGGVVHNCYPNGTPRAGSVIACRDNLHAQLAFSRAAQILTLGSVALGALRPDLKMTSAHGQTFSLPDGRTVFTTFHPAAALRRAEWHDAMEQDIKRFGKAVRQRSWAGLTVEICAGCRVHEDDMEEIHFDSSGLPFCQTCWLTSLEGRPQPSSAPPARSLPEAQHDSERPKTKPMTATVLKQAVRLVTSVFPGTEVADRGKLP